MADLYFLYICSYLTLVIYVGYTMFNVYLPKLLEARNSVGAEPKSLEGTLWDVVIFTIGGCPGAVVRIPIPIFVETRLFMA